MKIDTKAKFAQYTPAEIFAKIKAIYSGEHADAVEEETTDEE
jgi:hypothetical protein